MISHLDLDWEMPDSPTFFRRLSSFCRLIRFDKRGTGLSDRGIYAATLEERTDDIRAVMEAAGSERAFIFGESEGGNMACVFAATYPQRTRGLMLWGTQARWVKTDDYPWGRPPEEQARWVERLAGRGATAEDFPELSDEEVAQVLRYWRAAASPTQLAALFRLTGAVDTRGILGSIRVPTVVMNRVGDPFVSIDAARALAEAIPGARLAEFPGDKHDESGPPGEDEIVGAIQEFVTGERPPPPELDTVLSTVLFTDIIGSTEKQAELGDRRWKDLVLRHHTLVRESLARYRGRENDTAGDGFYATFDGPARAVRCAQEIIDHVRSLGIEVRAGVHTGECEVIEGKCGGLAVSIGARVAATAGPSEIVVSQTVKDLVAGSGLRFEDRGEHELKGVPDRWRLYRVVD
jgi:class 3 adenylate cyclase